MKEFSKERDLQVWINGVLRRLGIPFFHLEGGNKGARRFHSKGLPDVIGWWKGKSFALEVKAPKGKINPEQIEMLERLKGQGVYATIVRAEDEFMAFLKIFTGVKL